MSSQKTKVVLGLGGLLAALALLRRKPITPTVYGANVEVAFTPRLSRRADEGIAGLGRISGRVSLSPTESVLEGQSIPLTVTVTNTSTQGGVAVAVSLTTKINVETSDKTVVLAQVTLTDSYAANGTKTYTYTITAPLGKGGQSLGGYVGVYDPNGVNIANGAATEPIVAISVLATIPASYIYYTALGAWQLIAATQNVPFGTDVGIGLSWKNSSNIPIVGHAALKVLYPDGVTIVTPPAILGQDQTGSIGATMTGVVFAGFNTTQPGTYTLTETLSYLGVVLAVVSYAIVVPVPAAPPVVQTIGASTITTNSAYLTGYVSALGTPPPGYGGFVIIAYGKVNKAGTVDWDFWTPWQSDGPLGYHDWAVTGLDPGSTYYFEMIGSIGGTTPKMYSFGGAKSFQTQSAIVYGATVAIT